MSERLTTMPGRGTEPCCGAGGIDNVLILVGDGAFPHFGGRFGEGPLYNFARGETPFDCLHW